MNNWCSIRISCNKDREGSSVIRLETSDLDIFHVFPEKSFPWKIPSEEFLIVPEFIQSDIPLLNLYTYKFRR